MLIKVVVMIAAVIMLVKAINSAEKDSIAGMLSSTFVLITLAVVARLYLI